ncbi:protein UPSTREAM OF FLC [Melia azedarach]|uniref:Protein UPSTREAM OF FLC n=1 Tax=Melia azedarach TaxID=155640 RepID=A0ACC1XXN5_MELAZ|nr:protein UPSTREAM OF FLC [Melia azedarach]
MEVIRSRRGSSNSSGSPDRAKVFMQPKVKPIRKVQVVYYLTRNGHLEHPHYMEVTHLANQPLRLKDVIDRLIVLRGKGMPSLYSWSCKRSYKSGYVWNDLAENDVIYPADGAEYVLKGSEMVENCSEKFQQLNVSLHSNRKPLTPNLHKEPDKTSYEHHQDQFDHQEEEEEEEEEEEYEEEEKTSYTSSTTPHSRCSRGVSTDELEEQETQNNNRNQTDHQTTPSSLLCREKSDQTTANLSKRFQDVDDNPADTLPPSRNSVLLQLISCGNLAVAKAKNVSSLKQPVGKKSGINGGLHKGVLCKSAVKVAEEEDMINFMSENPRFGNFQSEEKEYFSGSIVESASKDEIQPVLKKSNSYNEERSTKAGLGEAILEVEEEEKGRNFSFGVKGKCLPRKKSSSSSKKIRKIK